jgi:predicted N-formylglutamate amidohydrolase
LEPIEESELPLADHLRAGGPPPADVLVEVPHGATARTDFAMIAGRLTGALPERLEAFFHVNTDEGAPELALDVARRLAAAGRRVLVVRCRIPRTLIDVNRELDGDGAGMTAGLPTYVRDPGDRALLIDLHRRYTVAAEAAYAEVCGAGGLALALHTYAPRSVGVEVGDDVVGDLRRAYRPAAYRGWAERPPVDLITATPEDERLAPEGLVAALGDELARIGVPVAENSSYRLHPSTMGHRHARRWPGRVLCLEVRRDLVGAPWRPFVESRIGPRKVGRIGAALARALERALDARSR